jgi:hypothetical protein
MLWLALLSVLSASSIQAQIVQATPQSVGPTVTLAEANRSRDAALAYVAQEMAKLQVGTGDIATAQANSAVFKELMDKWMKHVQALVHSLKDNS